MIYCMSDIHGDERRFCRMLRQILEGNVNGVIKALEELVVRGRELTQFVSDFTWYLRNLLLVKTSEDPGEAIDVSSENLKAMEEEEGEGDDL